MISFSNLTVSVGYHFMDPPDAVVCGRERIDYWSNPASNSTGRRQSWQKGEVIVVVADVILVVYVIENEETGFN